jgi:thiamine biosynthesis lipoprotein
MAALGGCAWLLSCGGQLPAGESVGQILAEAVTGSPAVGEGSARFGGASMGTTFSIQVLEMPAGLGRTQLQTDVARLLDGIDRALSTWREDSELARFNAGGDTEWVAVDPGLWLVATEARRVAELSGGALDVTVGPLVELWGFGRGGHRARPPASDAIRAARERMGWEQLHVREGSPALRKGRGDLSVDLSALGKGYAIDMIAEHFQRLGIRRCLIEFGGELRACGLGPGGRPWRVGIERPGGAITSWEPVLELADAAVATSGDAHNVFEWRGRRFGHVIDPRSGWPVEHQLTSVSVVASTAMTADALATALFVLGPEQGRLDAEREGLAALFVLRDGDTSTCHWTPALARWLAPHDAEEPGGR